MRAHRIVLGWALVLVLGCGGGGSPGVDGGTIHDRDAQAVTGDGGSRPDSDAPPGDGGPKVNGGPRVDSGTMPELCTGGVDEDRDFQTDCADDECWTFEACIEADVRATVPGVVRCGDPIELDAAATAAACGAIGMPRLSDEPTECDAATTEVTALFFCDADGAAAALWIEERLETPRTTRMITDRRFEQTDYERASIRDWERHVSGPSTREGATGFPIHDGRRATSTPGTSGFRVISVRPVMPSDSISRLVGMFFVTSIIDLDAKMSTDTRRLLHTGGLTISVPARPAP